MIHLHGLRSGLVSTCSCLDRFDARVLRATPSRRKRWPSASRGDKALKARPAVMPYWMREPFEAGVRTWLSHPLFASDGRGLDARVVRLC
jgi:hypothetical protein